MTTCLIVTGATGELGSPLLRHLLSRADVDHVVATSRSRPIEAEADKLTALPGIDLADETGVALLRDTVATLGATRIGLLHCAGSFPATAPIHKMPLATIDMVFRDNMLTFLGAAQAVTDLMRQTRWGRLVAFTSHTQESAYPFIGPFNLSKAALLSAIRTIAHENARFGIACNAIAVATLKTETERRIKPNGRFKDWVPVDGLARYAVDLALSEVPQVNGSEIHYWQYSDSFFQQSIFERNSIDLGAIDA